MHMHDIPRVHCYKLPFSIATLGFSYVLRVQTGCFLLIAKAQSCEVALPSHDCAPLLLHW